MSLKSRVGKLENLIEPNEDRIQIICGSQETLEAQEEEFMQEHPDFDGLLVKVIDYFGQENAGM